MNQREFNRLLEASAFDLGALPRDVESELDARLRDQLVLAHVVGRLEDDELSLAWRSGLNEKLRALQPTPKRKSSWLAHSWRPVAMVGLAASVGLTLIVRMNVGPTATSDSLESELIRFHVDSAHALDLVGAGVLPQEAARSHSVDRDEELDWSSADLEIL